MSELSRSFGFDRKVRLSWLEATAEWTASGLPEDGIRSRLDLLLAGDVNGKEARKKTKTVLMRTWFSPPEEFLALRDAGLALLKVAKTPEAFALHWGMVCAMHPVVWETAQVVGRLLALQEEASLSQVRSRLLDVYGERSTVVRASQRILRSFVDWNILGDFDRGVYCAGEKRVLCNPEVTAWLMEASLFASGGRSRVLTALLASPALFPFEMPAGEWPLTDNNPRITIYRQSRNENLVSLQR